MTGLANPSRPSWVARKISAIPPSATRLMILYRPCCAIPEPPNLPLPGAGGGPRRTQSRRAERSFAARSSSREGLGTLPGFPSRRQRRAERSFAARSSSREGLGTLPGFPSRRQRRAERSFAARSSSREGLGTLPGFPSRSMPLEVAAHILDRPAARLGVIIDVELEQLGQ